MADENIFDEFETRELQTLSIFMTANADRTTITVEEFIASRLAQGVSPEALKQALLEDLESGGRIFGEFRSSLKSTARGSINRVRDAAEFSELGIDGKYRWSAVLVRTCDDCMDRHGVIRTWEGWEAQGLPRTGATVCRQNCHCVLIPAEMTELEPIRRSKK